MIYLEIPTIILVAWLAHEVTVVKKGLNQLSEFVANHVLKGEK